MIEIYEPKGAAREYSPLAMNYFKGCDHGCVYCYVPIIKKRFDPGYKHSDVSFRDNILNEVRKTARKFYNSPKQVFLSFSTDPYNDFDSEYNITSKVLEILFENRIPVAILSKGGKKILRDLEIFKKFGSNIKIGMSLTFTDDERSLKWEKNASIPSERFKTLKILKENNILTWASLEPVIDPAQSLMIMSLFHPYIDQFKIGKMNHHPRHEKGIDWTWFLKRSVHIMRTYDKQFYIKKDLLKFRTPDIKLFPWEMDMDHLCLKNNYNEIPKFATGGMVSQSKIFNLGS